VKLDRGDPIPPTVEWRRGRVRMVDQRALPDRLRFVQCATVDDVVDAITSLTVRGAPALGATGAYGVALAARTIPSRRGVRAAARRLARARPTAVNLAVGVQRALDAYEAGGADAALAEAERLAAEDVAANRAIGAFGAALLRDGARVLTHCNAGSLATAGYGTALGVIRAAAESGKRVVVWVGETRPVLQGARLTAWELARLGIPATVIADVMAGSLLASGDVDAVVVGADRIAANGDVANKIGTYPLAVLARRHNVPFVVAAPVSTVDLTTPDGAHIPVESRSPDEVRMIAGKRITPEGVAAANRAFDVTPASLVSAIVTERGVARRPYVRSLARLCAPGEAVTPRP
jgi:methylthioribose-1-phosphate isomerase